MYLARAAGTASHVQVLIHGPGRLYHAMGEGSRRLGSDTSAASNSIVRRISIYICMYRNSSIDVDIILLMYL